MAVNEFLTTQELADRYQVPVESVRKWRGEGTGPRGARFGKHVRYRLSDVEEWEREQQKRDRLSQSAGAA
jgi:hypothetical protein